MPQVPRPIKESSEILTTDYRYYGGRIFGGNVGIIRGFFMPTDKIIQISTAIKDGEVLLYALLEDGTIWVKREFTAWEQVK